LQRNDLSLEDTYIDNGASGKDFDRPAWNRLMDEIRAGHIDCVCVKDLSRFSRNYIETCEFLEKIFPFMGVRFISVNDGYDNQTPGDNNEGLIIALKSLVNDQYLRDISRKVCSAVKAKRERGEYTRGFAPYGYKKIEGHKGKLEPDPDTAPVIRDIFEWRAAGMSHGAICKRLDESGVLTPNEILRRERDIFHSDFFKSTVWRVQTLKVMLRNPVYIGTLEQGKENQRLYEHKPITDVPRDQWVITENAHEPIVSRELWETVNAIETNTRQAYIKSGQRPERTENVFKGFVVCGVCGSKMSRSYNSKKNLHGGMFERYYFLCPIHHQHPLELGGYRSIREDTLLDTVFPLVADKLQSAANLGAIIEKRAKRQTNPRAVLDSEISRISRELETLNQRMAGLYENYVVKLLNEQEYVHIKSEYERRADSLRLNIDELSRRATTIADVTDNHWLLAARAFQNPVKLTREMLEAVVERVEVFSPERVEMVWKFRDEFELLDICAVDGTEPELAAASGEGGRN